MPADLETFETIARNDGVRRLLLRLAALSRAGSVGPFLAQLAEDDDVDPELSAIVAELASDGSFLQAVDDYVQATQVAH